MAGLHDASGPAPSGSADIAVQKTGALASSDKGKLRVFISYSREDLDFADQLAAALDFSGFECLIDREGISGGEDWKRRLGNLISEADTVVFVLSPDSARSEICDWEVEEAARLNKRILPANCRPLEGVNPPPRLRDLNYIFFYKEPTVPGSGFGTGVPVVNSMQLARDAESDDPLRDVGFLQNNFWDCRRSIPAAGGVGSRDSRVAATDHRAATRQAQSRAISGRGQDGSGMGLPAVSEDPRSARHRSA
jgi:hypothetical protein